MNPERAAILLPLDAREKEPTSHGKTPGVLLVSGRGRITTALLADGLGVSRMTASRTLRELVDKWILAWVVAKPIRTSTARSRSRSRC